MKKHLFALGFLWLLWLIPCFSFAAEKIEIENNWVRVVRVTQAPHEKSAVRDHPASVVVYLSGPRQNDVKYFEAGKRADENPSDKPVEMIVTELKPNAPKAPGWPVALDPVKLDPKHHLVPVENSRVRVLRTILDPHLKSPMHEHPSYVVVYLTELHTTMTLGDGRIVDNPRKPGELAWRDPLKHVTENIGEKRAVEIQIELK